MKGYSFMCQNNSQVGIIGVKGAGKRSFLSLFFPQKNRVSLKEFCINSNTQNLLVILILDGIHLQNESEYDIITDLNTMCRSCQTVNSSILLVLNKIDLFYNKSRNPEIIREIYESYRSYLNKLHLSVDFIPFSFLAATIFHDLLNRTIDEEDCDDARILLAKIGRHLRKDMPPETMKNYLLNHQRAFQIISGETLIKDYLNHWKGK